MSDQPQQEMTLDQWCERLPKTHLVNQQLAELRALLAEELPMEVSGCRLQKDCRDPALCDEAGECRYPFRRSPMKTTKIHQPKENDDELPESRTRSRPRRPLP